MNTYNKENKDNNVNNVDNEKNVKNEKKKEDKNPLHSQCVKIYFDWYKNKFDMEPQFDGSDGNAMKKIIAFLEKNVKKDQNGVAKNEFLLNSWKFVLEKHSSWDKFYQKKRRIREISSNLSNIITDLKNENRHYTADGSKIDRQWLDELFKDTTIPQL